MCFEQIIELLSGLLTPMIGFVTVTILVLQYLLRNQQWRLALYDKRFPVYQFTMEYLAIIAQDGTMTYAKAIQFMRNTRQNEFLFKDEMKKYLKELYRKGLDLERNDKLLKKESDDQKRTKLIEKNREIFDWFNEQFNVAPVLFGKYLRIDKR